MLRQNVLEGAAGWPGAEEAHPGALPLSEPHGARTGAGDPERAAGQFFRWRYLPFSSARKQIGKGVIGVHASLTACCLLLSQE